MIFSNDALWLNAKKIAKSSGYGNKWIEIIDYYNINGGKHVQIMAVIGREKFRILYLLDHSNEDVLLLSKNNRFEIKTYEEVEESNKIFIYEEEPLKIESKLLPEGTSVMDSTTVDFYV